MMIRLKDRLGGMAFWRPALRLGIPVAVQNLLISSFGLVDTLMLGQLGDTAVASVGMAGQWSWLMHIVFYGISSGAAVFLSQYWGAKDHRGIRRAYGILAVGTLGIALVMALVATLLPGFIMGLFSSDPLAIQTGVSYLRIAGFSYIALALSQVFSTVLRSTEEVRLPLVASVFGVIGNTVLNYALIFGRLGLPQLGVQGAALATVISAWIGPLVIFFVSLKRRNLLICPLRELLSFDAAFVRHFVRVSTPALLNEGMWALGTMGYNMVYGRMGTMQYASLTIFRTIEGLFFAFYGGLCHACGVLVGREIGAGRIEEGVRYGHRFTTVMPIISIGIAAIMIATRGPFLSLFDVSPEVSRMASLLLLLYAIEMPIRNIPYITICGVFRPGGDTRIGVLYDLISVWLMALPLTIVLGLVLKLDFVLVYACMLIAEDWVKAALCIRRLRGRKWIMPVVDK